MNRRFFLRLATVWVAAAGAGVAMPAYAVQQTWVPGHVVNNDPTWSILNGAQVAIDESRGTMTAQFTDPIRHMDGQALTIGGFVMPLDSRARFTHFVLTRRNSS